MGPLARQVLPAVAEMVAVVVSTAATVVRTAATVATTKAVAAPPPQLLQLPRAPPTVRARCASAGPLLMVLFGMFILTVSAIEGFSCACVFIPAHFRPGHTGTALGFLPDAISLLGSLLSDS